MNNFELNRQNRATIVSSKSLTAENEDLLVILGLPGEGQMVLLPEYLKIFGWFLCHSVRLRQSDRIYVFSVVV